MRLPAAVAAGACAFIAAVAVLATAGFPASTYRNTDFFHFWVAPRAVLEGTLPYDRAWFATVIEREQSRITLLTPEARTTPGSPYPLWTVLPLVPLAMLPIQVAAAVWFVGQITAIFLGIGALARVLLRRAAMGYRIALFALTISFEPFWGIIGGGNMSGFLFGALAGALAATIAGHGLLAGALLGLLVLKPHLSLVTVPVFLLACPPRQRPAIAAGTALAAGSLVVVSFLVRPDWPLAWLEAATVPAVASASNATVWTIGRLMPLGSATVVAALAAAASLAFFVAWWRARRPDLPVATAAAASLSLFVAPHARTYDQIILLLAVAVAVERISRRDPLGQAAGVIATLAVAVLAPWYLYSFALARGGGGPLPSPQEELSALVPLACFALVVLADRWPFRAAAAPAPLRSTTA
jgi:hypothetical protein